jgi:hypothetical protein
MATVSHSGQHTNANDAIEALQAKVGVDSSAVTTSLDYRVAQLELGGGGGGGASVTVSDTAPSSPSEGDLWFESDTGDILVYYGSAWVDVGGTSVANIAVQSTAPTSPVNGDLWFDTDTAQTFVWYDDGTSTQWVEVGAASAAASGTDGAVQFASGGAFSSDASNLVWDDTNNRLGIGTSTPTVDLEVAGTVKAGDLVGNVTATSVSTTNLTVDTDTLYVDSTNDRVGIGTTSPAYDLHVEGTGGFGSGTAAASIATTDTGNSAATLEMLTGSGSAFDISLFAAGATPANAVYLNNRNNSPMVMQTNNTERLRIDSSGNVGIGTTSPNAKLDVEGTINQPWGSAFTQDGVVNTKLLNVAYTATGGWGNYVQLSVPNNSSTVGFGEGAMVLTQSGWVVKPKQPAFWVEHVSNALVLTANVTTIVPWNTENYDVGNNISSGRFTAPVDGWYSFHTQLLVSKSSATRIDLKFLINGSNSWVNEFQGLNTGSVNRSINGSCILYLTRSDYVEVAVTNVGVGGTLYANSQSVFHHFAGYLLG